MKNKDMRKIKRKSMMRSIQRGVVTTLCCSMIGLPVFAEAGGKQTQQKVDQSLETVEEEPLVEEEKEPREIITIATEEEWRALAENCVEDSFSENIVIELQNNITFYEDFVPIPYMMGTFDGKGYTLSGITRTGMASDEGVFRYVSTSGQIKNLNLQVDIAVSGTKDSIGGLVGHNEGLVENCKVSGTITAEQRLGGIVAVNEVSGVILNCTNEATLYGKNYVGGLCGVNEGFIVNCMNLGMVDHTSEYTVFANCGGITGYNHGVIGDCINEAVVGYKHLGYNVGGIAGLQDGYLYECENQGEIIGRKDVGGIVGQFTPYTEVIYEELLLETIDHSTSQIQNLTDQLNQEMTHFGELTAKTSAVMALDTYDMVEESGMPEVPELSFEMDPEGDIKEQLVETQRQVESISIENEALKQDREQYSVEAQKSMDRITSLTKSIGNEIKVVNSAVDGIKADSQEEILIDLSNSENRTEEHGYLKDCRNSGMVHGDSHVGGIVGTIDFDNTENPEEDIKQIGELSVKFQATIQAVVDSSVNTAPISSTNQYAGGIVGYAARGYIQRCSDQADVEVENGSYVGGIIAYGEIPVDDCKVHASLQADSFAGGIAGYADSITNCASVVEITGCGEKKGAIAAVIPKETSNNYFTSDTLGGVDGINYVGRAEKLSMEQMKNLLDMDRSFFDLKIVFRAGDEIVKTLTIPYHGSIDLSEIPEVPEKDEESFGVWENFETERLETSKIIEAEYEELVQTIATEEDKPIMLLEGKFYPDSHLVLSEQGGNPEMEHKNIVCHMNYDVKSDCDIWMRKAKVVHYFMGNIGSKLAEVYCVGQDGKIYLVDSKWKGQYLQFDPMGSQEFYIALVDRNTSKKRVLRGVNGLIIIIGILILGIRRKRVLTIK